MLHVIRCQPKAVLCPPEAHLNSLYIEGEPSWLKSLFRLVSSWSVN